MFSAKRVVFAAAALAVAAGVAQAGLFTAGNLVVSIVGDGSAALSSAATPTFIQEYTTAGSTVGSSINLTSTALAGGRNYTNSGSQVEAFLTLSGNGQYLTIGGYAATVGTSAVAGTTSSATNRVVARIDSNGNVDFSTALTDAASGGNFRSVCSTDGVAMWGVGSTGGIRSFAFGGTTSTQLATAPANTRVANVLNGQLLLSAQTTSGGNFVGLSAVGVGTPTTSGQTVTLLPGFPGTPTAAQSAYDFWMSDANTMYVADDRSAASGGGIQKWALSGGTWTLSYTIALGTGSAGGGRGLVGTIDGLGQAHLYATTTETAANRLVEVIDTGTLAGATVNTLATAATNTAFRGVDFAPVPAPGSLALLGLGGLAAFRRRR
jgi:hypothetical protein